MRKYIFLSLLTSLVLACSGGDDDSSQDNNQNNNQNNDGNTAPTKPTLTNPTDNKLCMDNSLTFQWEPSTDAQSDPITYQIQIAKDIQFLQIAQTVEGTQPTQAIILDKNTAYYWRVKATDSKGLAGDYSTTFKFYTSAETVTNHLPFVPELVLPALNSTLNRTSITLSWNATDPDTGDTLVFDVYFGTANPPTQKISENITAKTKGVTVPNASREYFWKVVSKDNKGGMATGQIWSFKTN